MALVDRNACLRGIRVSSLGALALAACVGGVGPAFAQGGATVIEVELRTPAPVTLPAGATAKLRLFEGGVADHPNPPVYGQADYPVGRLALPASLKLPISDAAGLARAMMPSIGVRIESGDGKLLFVNQRRHGYKPGTAQSVILAPIVP